VTAWNNSSWRLPLQHANGENERDRGREDIALQPQAHLRHRTGRTGGSWSAPNHDVGSAVREANARWDARLNGATQTPGGGGLGEQA